MVRYSSSSSCRRLGESECPYSDVSLLDAKLEKGSRHGRDDDADDDNDNDGVDYMVRGEAEADTVSASVKIEIESVKVNVPSVPSRASFSDYLQSSLV